MLGESLPFSSDELVKRYGGREAYVAAWDGAVDDLMEAGLDIGPDEEVIRTRGRETARGLFS